MITTIVTFSDYNEAFNYAVSLILEYTQLAHSCNSVASLICKEYTVVSVDKFRRLLINRVNETNLIVTITCLHDNNNFYKFVITRP